MTRALIPEPSRPAVRTLVAASALYWTVEFQDNGSVAVLHTPAPSEGEKALWSVLLWLANHPAELCAAAASPHVDEQSRAAIGAALKVAFSGVAEGVAAA